MTSGVQVLETVTRLAPLGVRFWDPVDGAAVSEGLSAAIWPAAQPELASPAVVNRSDIFTFQNLSGLREIEYGAGDDAFWSTHPPRYNFVIQVQDAYGRFLPFQMSVRLPVRGLSDAVPLFSAPARSLIAPMAVIRAQLFDPMRSVPAAWVLAEASFDGGPAARGLSDASGGLLLPMPYPEAPTQSVAAGSPLLPGGTKLADQSWQIRLRFFYAPQRPVPAIPDLTQVLHQTPATAWEDEPLSAPMTGATLRFGQELVLRTRARPASPPAAPTLSTLLITPAGSPP